MSRQAPFHAGQRVILGAWATATMCFAAAVTLLTGCGASAASTAQTRVASPPSLSACVRRWNNASLGEGTESARLYAFKGTSALMLRFPDGACGLVFQRTKVAAGEQQREPLVSFLDSNWAMGLGPLGYVAPSKIAALQADANRETNVFVRKSNGHVLARRGARIVSVPENVFINEPGCEHFLDPKSITYERYEVLRTTVACVVARALGWAWPARQQSANQAGKPTNTMRVIGWQCVGSELIQGLSPTTYEKITCTRRKDVVELRSLARQLLSQSPPGG